MTWKHSPFHATKISHPGGCSGRVGLLWLGLVAVQQLGCRHCGHTGSRQTGKEEARECWPEGAALGVSVTS